jgi:hypothetical protein
MERDKWTITIYPPGNKPIEKNFTGRRQSAIFRAETMIDRLQPVSAARNKSP